MMTLEPRLLPKFVGVQIPDYLDRWCKTKGVEKFGRNNSKSDFIRAVLMEAYDKDMKK